MCANRYLQLTMRQPVNRQPNKNVDLQLHGEQLIANHPFTGLPTSAPASSQPLVQLAPEEMVREGSQHSASAKSVTRNTLSRPTTTVGRRSSSVQTELTLQDLKNLNAAVNRTANGSAPSPPKTNPNPNQNQNQNQKQGLEVENEKLKERIASLEKQVERLNNEVTRITKENSNMLNERKQLTRSYERALEDAEKYRLQYEQEKAAHFTTKDEDGKAIGSLRNEMSNLRRTHEDELAMLDSRYAKEIEALRKEMQIAISERDQRLERLKLQISDSMKSNSHERQLQIEDLVKQVTTLQSENETLRSQIKRSKHGGDDSQLKGLQQQLLEKERLLLRLADLCSKFESQMKQNAEFTEILQRVYGNASANGAGSTKLMHRR